MSYAFAALEAEYTALLQRMIITRPKEIDRVARKLIEYVDQKRYADACDETGVPQIVAATSFEREASSNFQDGPAQGDPWNKRSHNWPPCGPFNSWTEAAVWAYRHEGFDKIGAANWSWERACYEEELFNGFGPRNHGRHTGYLWAGSNIYTGGKYVKDGVWSATVIDSQLGVIPMMVRIVQLRPSLNLPIPFSATPATGAFIPAPHASPTEPHDTEALQQALNHLGADPQLDVDGNYGRMTQHAVMAFQAAHGLAADGLAGPDTWVAIAKAEAT